MRERPGEAAPFGDLLKRHRVAAGISQESLAERAQVSTAAIGALERGTRRAPYRETVVLLAAALDLSERQRAELEASAQRARRRGTRGNIADQPARHNLAARLTSFVGRLDEIAELTALLRKHRLVTVTGSGGVGKTSIAVEVARELHDAGEREAWFVDLSPVLAGAFVAGAIASILDVPLPQLADPLPALAVALRERRLLLVLDNCEHVIGDAAAAASALLRSCPGVVVLATSRERLAIDGEQVYRLPSLPVPAQPVRTSEEACSYAAVRLFVERATAVDARLAFTAERLAMVAQICAQLEGIPLAIELAASRLPSLGFEALNKRLTEQFVIASASRDRPHRQQTIFAAIAWSYDLLGDDERALLRRLAVFCGGATLDAIEDVCAGSALATRSVPDLLTSLVDKSLLNSALAGERCRYVMLESVRAFAGRQSADAGELGAIARAHARWLARVAERGDQRYPDVAPNVWLAEFGPELDNARAALEWTLASDADEDVLLAARIVGGLRRLWISPQRRLECRRWSEAILSRLDLERHALVAGGVMRAYIQSIDGAAILAAADDAAVLFERIRDRRGLISLHAHVAWEYGLRGAFADAERALALAFELASAEGLQHSRHFIHLLETRCLIYGLAGRLAEARADAALASALRDALAAPDVKLEFYWQGFFAFADGDARRAAELLEVCVDAARARGESRAGPLSELAAARLVLGDLDGAESALRESLELAPSERLEGAWRAIQHMATVSALRRQPRIAARLLGFVDAWCEREAGFRGYYERATLAMLADALHAQLSADAQTSLMAAGALLDVERAIDEALAPNEMYLTRTTCGRPSV
ncbi:MAG TPA: helix-turn-helix domain-containing protein [Candidatus Sulfotelmatobacter sp.]|nr:helix-turn-helix domain-containing protein [Candidatus Sulfotelmatobacter sp.]